MRLSLYIMLLALPLSACSLLNQIVPAARPDGSARLPVNNPQLIAEFTRRHPTPLEMMPDRYQAGYGSVELSLVQMLEQYIPATYQVFPAPGIQLERKVSYDRSRAWTEAVIASLANSGLVATIDTARHAVFINAQPAALHE
jgi:hypothetical protein